MSERSIFGPLNGFVRDEWSFRATDCAHMSPPWTVALRLAGDVTLFLSDETAVAVARALLRQVAENQGSDDVWATYRANITAGAVAA